MLVGANPRDLLNGFPMPSARAVSNIRLSSEKVKVALLRDKLSIGAKQDTERETVKVDHKGTSDYITLKGQTVHRAKQLFFCRDTLRYA